jgi:hypothetical protein
MAKVDEDGYLFIFNGKKELVIRDVWFVDELPKGLAARSSGGVRVAHAARPRDGVDSS